VTTSQNLKQTRAVTVNSRRFVARTPAQLRVSFVMASVGSMRAPGLGDYYDGQCDGAGEAEQAGDVQCGDNG
jgi:hypothetical protein